MFKKNNQLLEQIQKCLEDYLESKRMIFSRFFFLSNDELLEILSQTRNPQAVQPHMRKCFDAIQSLEFGVVPGSAESPEGIKYTNDIHAMISPEKERVAFGKGLKARGNVEVWLCSVEENMVKSLHALTKIALADYQVKSRRDWMRLHPSQVVLTVSQIMWCSDVTRALQAENPLEALIEFEKKCIAQLAEAASVSRENIPKLFRQVLGALITIDVHARDIITDMIAAKVKGVDDFEWTRQLRYYWDHEIDDCVVRMSSSRYVYAYEYLGASPRLVITPLTDRCYLCLMGALQVCVSLWHPSSNSFPFSLILEVPRLARPEQERLRPRKTWPRFVFSLPSFVASSPFKALGTQCVVFNCSEGLDYRMMGKFFSGLAQSGAWCCFDEFNRIDIEVLSVIAQQILTIRNAKVGKLTRFMFEGREIRLIPKAAAFITMNPGYAGLYNTVLIFIDVNAYVYSCDGIPAPFPLSHHP
jgi:dynein heavy chain